MNDKINRDMSGSRRRARKPSREAFLRKKFYVLDRQKDPHAFRGACGKITYTSKGLARSNMKNHESSGHDEKSGKLNIYFCNMCDGFHVGHR